MDVTLAASTVTVEGGLLEGTGTVNSAVLVENGGEVKPGDSPGTLTVSSYDQTSSGDLVIQIASANSFDILDVNGEAQLAGTLDFELLNSFQLRAGQNYVFLDYGSLSGTFGSVDLSGLNLAQGLNASVVYDYLGGDDVALTIQGPANNSAPEPATWILFGGSLAALAAVRKRGWFSSRKGCGEERGEAL